MGAKKTGISRELLIHPGETIAEVLGHRGISQAELAVRTGAYADAFWMSLFHELGHIVNGDVGKNAGYIDSGEDERKEAAADAFARDMLISRRDYRVFVEQIIVQDSPGQFKSGAKDTLTCFLFI